MLPECEEQGLVRMYVCERSIKRLSASAKSSHCFRRLYFTRSITKSTRLKLKVRERKVKFSERN